MPYKKARAKSAAKTRAKAPPKKRRRKKINTKDRIYAVVVAAVLVLAAAAASVVTVYLRSAKAGAVEGAASVSSALPASQAPAPAVEAEAPSAGQPPVQKPEPERLAPAASKPDPAASAPAPAAPAVTAAPVRTPPPETSSPAAAAVPVKTAPAIEPKAAETRALPAASQTPGGVPERPSVAESGTLVFLIDDAGHNLRDLEPFLKFPGPMTIAVLPGLPYSAEAARRIRAAGKEVFLHQPMESIGGHNPGPGAIMAGMGRDEIRAIINKNLNEVGPVAGINNHEGSRITMDDEAMETILAVCRERGILFCDSRTTAETAAPRVARRLGITIGERDVFLDNVQERGSMIGYINTGMQRAGQNGSAIMIGHVWSPELAPLLSEMFPDLTKRGYSFSSVSKAINGKGL